MKYSNLKIKKQKKGAAIVEFAILTTVMVPLLLYVTFFSELLQFRLKLDEMTYFATWEMTSYNMSDYKNTPNSNAKSKFNAMKTEIKNATLRLYGNLDSADPNRSIGYIMITPDVNSFTVEMEEAGRNGDNDAAASNNQDSSSESTSGPLASFVNKMDGFIGRGINFVAGKLFGFNTDYIGNTAQVSGSFSISSKMNTRTMTKDTGGFTNNELLKEGLAGGNATTITTVPFTVWVDTWSLNDGRNVDNTKATRQCSTAGGGLSSSCDFMPYAKQVQRMSLLGTPETGFMKWISRGVRIALKLVGSGGIAFLRDIPLIGGLFSKFEDPVEARMVSINYYYNTDHQNGNYTQGSIPRGQTRFQTSPLVHIFTRDDQGNSDASKGIREYRETLRSRRNFYMGNNEPYCNFNGTSEKCEDKTP